MHGLNFGLLVRPAGARKAPRVLELFLFSPRPADLRKVLPAFPRLATSTQIKNVPVLASKKEHTRLSKSALATATRLDQASPQVPSHSRTSLAHTLRQLFQLPGLFSPKHTLQVSLFTTLNPCLSTRAS